MSKTPPTLSSIALKTLERHPYVLNDLQYTPYMLLKSALQKCTVLQLEKIESLNPYILIDSDELWQPFVEKLAVALRTEWDCCDGWREAYKKLKQYEADRVKNIGAKLREKKKLLEQEKHASVRLEKPPPLKICGRVQKPFKSNLLNKLQKELSYKSYLIRKR